MARKFQKKRPRRKPGYNDRQLMALDAMLVDKRSGYEVPVEAYDYIKKGEIK